MLCIDFLRVIFPVDQPILSQFILNIIRFTGLNMNVVLIAMEQNSSYNVAFCQGLAFDLFVSALMVKKCFAKPCSLFLKDYA